MKKSITLLVALLCMASLMAAMAFNSGYVHNWATLKVTSTDTALVAVVPGTGLGNKDATAFVENGTLEISFGKSGLGNIPGLQPKSRYTWDNLFTIKNNSKEKVQINITVGEKIDKFVKFYINGQDASKWVDVPSDGLPIKAEIIIPQGTKLEDFAGPVVVNTKVVE